MGKANFCDECGRFLGQRDLCPKCDTGQEQEDQRVREENKLKTDFFEFILLAIVLVLIVSGFIAYFSYTSSAIEENEAIENSLVMAYSNCSFWMKKKVARPNTIRIRGLNDMRIENIVKKDGNIYTVETSLYSLDDNGEGIESFYTCVAEHHGQEQWELKTLDVTSTRSF